VPVTLSVLCYLLFERVTVTPKAIESKQIKAYSGEAA